MFETTNLVQHAKTWRLDDDDDDDDNDNDNDDCLLSTIHYVFLLFLFLSLLCIQFSNEYEPVWQFLSQTCPAIRLNRSNSASGHDHALESGKLPKQRARSEDMNIYILYIYIYIEKNGPILFFICQMNKTLANRSTATDQMIEEHGRALKVLLTSSWRHQWNQ